MLNSQSILDIVLQGAAILITIVMHEIAHGYVAYVNGDDTAKRAGRLTLNPIKHLSLPGLISMAIFRFGWAKPVPIDPSKFRHRKSGMIQVSIAGIVMNFVLAVISAFILANVRPKSAIAAEFFSLLFIYNVSFGVFNALPFPPLDGSKVIATFLPRKWEAKFYEYERYLYMILILLIFTNVISRLMGPLIKAVAIDILSLF